MRLTQHLVYNSAIISELIKRSARRVADFKKGAEVTTSFAKDESRRLGTVTTPLERRRIANNRSSDL